MHRMKHKLSTERIVSLRRHAAQHVDVVLVAETGSTNTDLLASLGPEFSPTLLIAEKQTAGRGRSGRAWHSSEGASLTFSLAWKFHCPIQKLVGLPLAIGVALAEALAVFDVYVQLKWPNDVLRDGKKLAGILIETGTVNNPEKEEVWAVIGVGLNLAMPEMLEAAIGEPAADAPWLAQMDRSDLMAALLNSMSESLILFENAGFEPFMSRWNKLHAFAGMPVRILDRGQVLHEGLARGVDASGYLMLETGAGPVAVLAGDVSLRAMEEH